MAQRSEEGHVHTSIGPSGGLLGILATAGHDQPWSNPLILLLVAGAFALGLLGWTRDNRIESVSVAILVAGAAVTSGAILGFLFGIPRALQDTRSGEAIGKPSELIYQVNTNLEQISDWLTKIIVGLGLVHFRNLQTYFTTLAESAAGAFRPAIPTGLASAIIIYFAILGFLGSYLWTRLLLTLEFTRADRAARQSPEFYEGLVQALLYQPGPDGFEAAIRNGEEFLRRYGQGNWRIWRSLACAYGQKYRYLQLQESPDPGELQRARNQALEAVKRVLFLNPDEREGIRALWDPTRATPQEDDLTVFASDDAFRALLDSAHG